MLNLAVQFADAPLNGTQRDIQMRCSGNGRSARVVFEEVPDRPDVVLFIGDEGGPVPVYVDIPVVQYIAAIEQNVVKKRIEI